MPVPGERALDIGCGTGNHSVWLAEKGLTVVGLDESPAMLEVAAAKAAGTGLDVAWVLGDASAPPFEEEPFDLVVSVAALEFVEARRQVLREAMRVLRPGGRLVLGLLTRDSPWGERHLRDAAERVDSVFANASFFTEDELPALLDAPYILRKGLYHPPDPDLDRRAAEQVEGEKQALQEDRAGFISARWEKEKS
jgi:ubiquinone/menaquinone biosynthesis C-methylase UbiE